MKIIDLLKKYKNKNSIEKTKLLEKIETDLMDVTDNDVFIRNKFGIKIGANKKELEEQKRILYLYFQNENYFSLEDIGNLCENFSLVLTPAYGCLSPIPSKLLEVADNKLAKKDELFTVVGRNSFALFIKFNGLYECLGGWGKEPSALDRIIGLFEHRWYTFTVPVYLTIILSILYGVILNLNWPTQLVYTTVFGLLFIILLCFKPYCKTNNWFTTWDLSYHGYWVYGELKKHA